MLLLLRFWWAIPIAILTATTAYYRHEAAQEREQRHIIAAEYQAFTSVGVGVLCGEFIGVYCDEG